MLKGFEIGLGIVGAFACVWLAGWVLFILLAIIGRNWGK